MKKPTISRAEAEAKTRTEKNYWGEARARVDGLLVSVERLRDYLNGKAADPSYVNNVYKEAQAIYVAMQAALAIRVARFEGAQSRKRRR